MCLSISLAIYFPFPIGLLGTKLKLKASQSTWYKLHLDQLVKINASIVWRWTRYHEVRRPEISLRHLTFSDSISRPTLSLAPISIIFDDISINSHWLEPSYQVSGPVKHFKNIYLQFIVSDPVRGTFLYLIDSTGRFDQCKPGHRGWQVPMNTRATSRLRRRRSEGASEARWIWRWVRPLFLGILSSTVRCPWRKNGRYINIFKICPSVNIGLATHWRILSEKLFSRSFWTLRSFKLSTL